MGERDAMAAVVQMAGVGGCRPGDAMRVTFSQVRGFVTVASTGSFTRAAAVLHLSQSALTTRIRQLEEALGLRLFDRNTRSVDLTDSGRQLLPIFLRLVGDLEDAVINAREHARRANGIVRVACLPSCAATLMPDLIAQFRALRPEATVVVEDAIDSQVRRLVRDREVDFGICAFQEEEPGLHFEDLFEDRLQVVHRPQDAIGKVSRVTVADLSRHPLILMKRGTSVRRVVEEAFAAAGCSPAQAYEVSCMSTAVALVQAGLGLALLPSTALEMRTRGVQARPVNDAAFGRRLVLVRRRSATLRRIAQAFAESVLIHAAQAPAMARA